MANAPTIKPWGQEDKDQLQQLINQGKVDITKTTNTDYIDSVWHKYFWARNNRNFCRNFRSYAQAHEHEDCLSGYYRERGGGIELYLLFILFYFIHYI
jgi:hypothetical protein